MITFSPFPVIETKNLFLRRMTNDDTHDIFQLRKDPKMNYYTDTRLDETQKKQSHILIK